MVELHLVMLNLPISLLINQSEGPCIEIWHSCGTSGYMYNSSEMVSPACVGQIKKELGCPYDQT
jgi:hypothetical protein